MQRSKILLILLFVLLSAQCLLAQEVSTYQLPPKEIVDITHAPELPGVMLSPNKEWMLLIEYGVSHSSIKRLAEPELRIAGLRINPDNNGPSKITGAKSLRLKRASQDSTVIQVKGLPQNPAIAFYSWSPDGTKIAFCQVLPQKIELWLVDVPTAKAYKVTNLALNAIFWNPYIWMTDSKSLLCRVVPANRGQAPQAQEIATGPVIQSSEGKDAPSRTYQDLLKNAHDEALFEYYLTGELVKVSLKGKVKSTGQKGIINSYSVSPDSKYMLLQRIHRPYSYAVTAYRFPLEISVYDFQSKALTAIHDTPLQEGIPLGRDATQATSREFGWRLDVPSTLYWVDSQDKGDPKAQVAVRDKLFTLDAPFTGSPKEIAQTKLRFNSIIWGNDTTAILVEKWWKDRKIVWTYLNPAKGRMIDTLFKYSSENRYTDPGEPVKTLNQYAQQVLLVQPNGAFFLFGQGASAEGDRPFLDAYTLSTRRKERIWQSQPGYYETGVDMINPEKQVILVKKESVVESPNYFTVDIGRKTSEQVTFFPNPFRAFKQIQKQTLSYKRSDSLALTANLYLPAGYTAQMGPLPTFVSAYPVAFKDKAAAEQVYGSPYAFVKPDNFSSLYATQGYAVIEAPFPIVPEEKKEANDTFIKQLIMNSEAVIRAGVQLGVVDSARVAVGGHSYGAFMTANLLTHSRLFKAGIAMSGAYNRTLTPFGFQSEYRTYWEVPELYTSLSPFHYANKMKLPLLLIHGEADSNAGTHTLQSERYFNALKGLGATVRYVSLPYEGHTYQAIESQLHVYWEVCRWLEKYVKGTVAFTKK